MPRSKTRAVELKAIPVYIVDDFEPDVATQTIAATTTNSSTALSGTGESLFVYNTGANPVDVKVGSGAQDAGTGSTRRIYPGERRTIRVPTGAGIEIGVKATTGTTNLDVQRGSGTKT